MRWDLGFGEWLGVFLISICVVESGVEMYTWWMREDSGKITILMVMERVREYMDLEDEGGEPAAGRGGGLDKE